MKRITIILVLLLVLCLTACGIVAFAANDDRQSIESLVVEEVAPNGEICVLKPFYGGDTKEDVKGYIAEVYDDVGVTTYCVYVEIESVNSSGIYRRDEIEIDADIISTRFHW